MTQAMEEERSTEAPLEVVDAGSVRVWSDDAGVVHVAARGEEYRDVRPVKAFPLSKKVDYVSFLSQMGKEVVLMGNLGNLDKNSRKALDHALERMYYTARIQRVLSISETMGISKWQVVTDRGFATFEVVARDHIRELPGGKYVITDADGNRFEIPCIADLDRQSQTLVFSET